ncbi:MAG TPA: hypothetical protein VGK58_06265 [Lacipirellulaceae bacterium]
MFTFNVGAGLDSDGDDDDVAWMFKAFNDFGHDSSLLLRTIRQLIYEGKPTGPITLLQFRLGEQLTHPFGAIYTGTNAVSFWPVYPRGQDMTEQCDHVTLDLRSGKSLHRF